LTRAQRFDACTMLSLEGRERGNAMERLRVIEPFDRPRPVSVTSLRRKRRHAVIKHALTTIHSANPADGLWTAAAARIDLHRYQIEPALAAIAGATRLLLADAVGLGKTIQAGLLLSELYQRAWVERALIVCPAGLRDTWQRELLNRFGISAAVLDQQSIADRIAQYPPGVNPWIADSIAIVSIDFIKRDEVLAALEGVPVDLLIADEAHHLSPGTDRGAALARLAARAAWCVLVTATPHSGDPDAFVYLTGLGRHADPITIFRRQRHDVGLDHTRRTHFLKVRTSDHERALFDAIAAYSRAIWSGRGRDDHAARLIAITIARRATSSHEAIVNTLRRRRALLGVEPSIDQPRLPWEDVDDADGGGSDSLVSVQGLENIDDERAALDHLIELASRCDSRSKMVRLVRLLSRIDEPAIVFTEYRDTLDAIVTLLARSRRVAAIHGAMPADERRRAVDAFNDGRHDVLVATDAAGEGLNLHHRCRLVIDVELPWNPVRLEQRIGRVDRLGQRRPVHAIRMFHGATIEEEVLDRLSLRRRRADVDLDRVASEQDVAAAVFARQEAMPGHVPRLNTAAVLAAGAEVDRLTHQRRFGNARGIRARCYATPRNDRSRQLVALYRRTYLNRYGAVLGDAIEAYQLTLSAVPPSLAEFRACIDAVRVPVREAASIPAPSESLHHRLASIRRQLAREQRREFQRSLFDGRAEADQAQREHLAARLDSALERLQRAIAPAEPTQTRTELVAAWPGKRT